MSRLRDMGRFQHHDWGITFEKSHLFGCSQPLVCLSRLSWRASKHPSHGFSISIPLQPLQGNHTGPSLCLVPATVEVAASFSGPWNVPQWPWLSLSLRGHTSPSQLPDFLHGGQSIHLPSKESVSLKGLSSSPFLTDSWRFFQNSHHLSALANVELRFVQAQNGNLMAI